MVKAVYEQPFTDMLLKAELLLPQGEDIKAAKVKQRSKDENGYIIGIYHDNPLSNSIIYDVEFPDGQIKEYVVNLVARNMYSQADAERRTFQILDSIIDHAVDSTAVQMKYKCVVTRNGTIRLIQTTQGWKLLVLWKDGREEWIPLKLLKEENPIEVSEYAISNGIENNPDFAY